MTYVCDRNSQHALMSIGNSRVLACGASFTGCTAEPAGLLGAPFPISQHCFRLEMWLALKGTLPFCTLNRDPYIMSTPLRWLHLSLSGQYHYLELVNENQNNSHLKMNSPKSQGWSYLELCFLNTNPLPFLPQHITLKIKHLF